MMVTKSPPAAEVVNRKPFYAIFLPFPIACFTLTLFTDIAYWRTGNLMWENFSSWLLFAGLVLGGLGVVAAIVDFFIDRLIFAQVLPLVIGGAIALILALINSLVHAGDGWTAIVPYGLILSAVTVIVIAVTDWFCRSMSYRYYRRGERSVR
jgi:uncharacterized membrane protein